MTSFCRLFLVHHDKASNSSQLTCFHSRILGNAFPSFEYLGGIFHLVHHSQRPNFQEKMPNANAENAFSMTYDSPLFGTDRVAFEYNFHIHTIGKYCTLFSNRGTD